jgi:hypothetical protein
LRQHDFYFNSRGGTRTPDPVINSHLLYQLSYSGKRSSYGGCNLASGPVGVKRDGRSARTSLWNCR